MIDSFWAYSERLELMAFFIAYPLVYSTVMVIATLQHNKSSDFRNTLARLLPFSYAFIGTLFLGLVLKNLYPDYSIRNIAGQFQNPFLKIWALLAVLFWIPVLNKKPVFSLLHSLIFFFLLVKDIYLRIFSFMSQEIIRNDMKIFMDSFILNTCALIVIMIIYFLLNKLQRRKKDNLT